MHFLKGLELSERFYQEVVADILKQNFPELVYSAGLLGPGSEVLGFDTARSMDHDWGPRATLFLREVDVSLTEEIHAHLQAKLPDSFLGFPTHFNQIAGEGVRIMTQREEGKLLNHGIAFATIPQFFQEYLGIDPFTTWTSTDWLLMSSQKLRTIRSGRLFHDDLGLEKIRKELFYYPRDIWLYLMLSEWMKLSQEAPFMGRCGEVGDELGSRIIATRLVRSIMNLMFFLEQEYIPYSKWYGTAFAQLGAAEETQPILQAVLDAQDWRTREEALSQAYLMLGKRHNECGITEPIPVSLIQFHDRPFQIIDADRYIEAIRAQIKQHEVQNIPWAIGSANQITDTVDILEENLLLKRLREMYANHSGSA